MIPRLRRLRAIVLHRTPVREKDRVVEVFSLEEGRVRLLAAGVRRFPSRRAGHLEPLMESELTVSSSARGESIRDAKVLQSFPRVREDLGRLRAAYYLLRILHEGTPEYLPDRRLYESSRALLLSLDHPGRALVTPLFTLSADIQLLKALGVLPDAARCARCRQPLRSEAFGLDQRAPGFVCDRCEPQARASAELTNAVKVLRLLVRNPVPAARLQVSPAVLSALAALVRSFLRTMRAQVGLHLSKDIAA